MKTYAVILKASGAEVHRYQHDGGPVAWHGMEFDTHDHVELSPPPPQPMPTRVWTPAEFLRRLTQEERIAARRLALTDELVQDFMHLLDRVEDVRNDDPDTVRGLAYLTQVGVLAGGRAEEILHG
jgi:hypothetical protein